MGELISKLCGPNAFSMVSDDDDHKKDFGAAQTAASPVGLSTNRMLFLPERDEEFVMSRPKAKDDNSSADGVQVSASPLSAYFAALRTTSSTIRSRSAINEWTSRINQRSSVRSSVSSQQEEAVKDNENKGSAPQTASAGSSLGTTGRAANDTRSFQQAIDEVRASIQRVKAEKLFPLVPPGCVALSAPSTSLHQFGHGAAGAPSNSANEYKALAQELLGVRKKNSSTALFSDSDGSNQPRSMAVLRYLRRIAVTGGGLATPPLPKVLQSNHLNEEQRAGHRSSHRRRRHTHAEREAVTQ